MEIRAGVQVEATTATGERVMMVARSEPRLGRDLRIVWVSEAVEYEAVGEDAHQIPWPETALRVCAPA